MGNLFSCFHSKKSKHFNNRQIDNFDTSAESRSPIDPALYIVRPKTDEILMDSSVPEIRNHELHIRNSGAIATSSTRKSTILSNGVTSVQEVNSGTAAKDPNYQVSDNTVNALFEKYKDEDEDAILTEGIERLCEDLNYKPDDFAILVLAWRLDASQMYRFTKSEFIQGLRSLNADTVDGIRMRLEQTIEKLKVNAEMFKQLYRFTFRFGLEPDNRIVLLEMAISLWRLVFTVHKPDILDRWLDYLELHTNIRGIPKDTWNMFLNFAETCDITAYDDTEAWPSLFDDFVEYENDRLNQNLTVMPDTNIDGTKKETQISVNTMPSSPQNL